MRIDHMTFLSIRELLLTVILLNAFPCVWGAAEILDGKEPFGGFAMGWLVQFAILIVIVALDVIVMGAVQ